MIAVVGSVVDVVVGVGGGFLPAEVLVGANLIFVCWGPVGSIPSELWTLVCFDFSPRLGDASLPLLLVGLRLPFVLLVIVAHVASVRC